MTDMEKIKIIESAPEEMQLRIAKAFLREDINDDDIQYTFNEDSLDVLVEDGIIENIDAEEVDEGIGATTEFTIRKSKPAAGNKNYIRDDNGGWNTCIKGNPTDKDCDVLANCVGYASGRFNEIYNEITGNQGHKFKTLNNNAENWIERAQAAGLEIGDTPKPGCIICWRKGQAGVSSDGAGHVGIVEEVYADGSIYTSESAYKGSAFYNVKRNNSNGRWGMGSAYALRGFIYNPAVKEIEPTPAPEPSKPVTYKFNVGDKVIINGDLYKTANSTTPAGHATNIVTTITLRADGTLHPYNTGSNYRGWMDESSIAAYVEPEVPVVTQEFEKGAKVKIVGSGNGSSYGTGKTAYGIGWTRYVLDYYPGRAYPYKIGNNSGTTGYYKADALQRK